MNIHQKLSALEAVYSVYDRFCAGLEIACRLHCAHCCTQNVTLTTLEGYHLLRAIPANRKSDIERWLDACRRRGRFQPQLTINHIARLCAAGQEIPAESSAADSGRCPLLQADTCPFYVARPFACRCMVSTHPCQHHGHASMDPFVLTVNNLFLQTIEHLDAGGCSGNLVDVLKCVISENDRRADNAQPLSCRTHNLVPNEPMTVLMVPPDHRRRIQPVFSALQAIYVADHHTGSANPSQKR